MNEEEYTPDADTPSTQKQNFQKWIIVAGVLITIMFVTAFYGALKKEDKREQTLADEDVPRSLQEAEQNKNNAIAKFQSEIQGEALSIAQRREPQKLTDLPLRIESEPVENTPKTEKRRSFNKSEETAPKSVDQQYREQERKRVLMSLSQSDDMGNKKAFYRKAEKGQKLQSGSTSGDIGRRGDPRAVVTADGIAQKRSEVQKKIAEIRAYREGIESGEADASTLPPDMTAFKSLINGGVQ